MKKLGRHCLYQVIKVKIINNRTNWNCAPPNRMQWASLYDVLAQVHNIYVSNHNRKDYPKLRGSLQNNWSLIFISIKVIRIKKRRRNYSRLKKMKETWQINATHNSNWILLPVKRLMAQSTNKIWTNLTTRWSTKSVLMILITVLWWCRRISLFVEKTH